MASEQQKLNFMVRLHRDLAMAKTAEEISQSVLSRIWQIVPCLRASITLFDFKSDTVTTYSAIYENQSHMPPGTKLPLDSFGGDLDVLKNGEIDLKDDIDTLTKLPTGLQCLKSEGARSFVCIPIMYSKRLLGSINVIGAKPGCFKDKNLEDIVELVNPLAVAFHEAKLREELKQKNIELGEKVVELKKSEKKLRESNSNFRALAENASDGILIASGDGGHVYANTRASEITGYSVSELIEMGLKDLAHPDELDKLSDRYRKRLAGKSSPDPYETVVVRKDGKALPLEVTGAKTIWQGQPADIVIVRDIDKRKKSEDAVKDSERLLRAIIDIVPPGIFAYDRNGVCLLVNRSTAKLMGTTVEEITGENWGKFFPDKARFELLMQDSLDMLDSGRARITMEESVVSAKGDLRIFEVSKIPFSWPSTGEQVVLGVGVDVTRRKNLEKELIESEFWLQSIFNSINDAVFVFTPERKILDAKGSAEKIFGYSVEELIGQSAELLHVDQAHYLECGKHLESEFIDHDVVRFEFKLKRKNGEVFPTEHMASVLKNDQGEPMGLVGVIRDISERIRAEEELRQSAETIKVILNATKDTLALINPEGIVLAINEAGARRLNLSIDQVVSHRLDEFLPKDLAKSRHEKIKEVVNSGKHVQYFDKREGIFFDNSDYPVFDKSGKVKNVAVFARDITKQKLMEDKLRRQTSVLEGINRVFRDALMCDNEEEVALSCLSVAESLTGSEFGFIGEVDESGFLSTIALSDAGSKSCDLSKQTVEKTVGDMEIRGIWGRVIKDGKSLIANDPFSHPDSSGTPEGHPKINSFLGVPFSWSDKCTGIIALANKESGYDLQDQKTVEALSIGFSEALHRKRSEAALIQSEEKYRSLVESTEESIYLLDRDLRYLFANERYQRRFGPPMDKIINREYGDFHCKKETKTLKDMVHMVFESERSLSYEHRSDSDGRYFIRTLSPVRDRSGKTASVTVCAKDITERKTTEEALSLSSKKLQIEYRERKRLSKKIIDLLERERYEIGMELHDHIGQILTSLKMNLEMIVDILKTDDKEVMSNVHSAMEKVFDVLKVIKNLSHGLRSSTLDQLGLEASLREFFHEIQKDVNLDVHFFCRNMPKRFDRETETALYRIAQESLTNVLKHSMAKNVHLSLVKKGELISLSVEDDGVGFDYEKVMKKASERKGPLGLLIMRERAFQLSGNLIIETRKGKGTHLLAEIPI